MLLKRGPVYVYPLAGRGKGKGVTSTSSLQENLSKNLTFSCPYWNCRGTLLGHAQESCHLLWTYLQTQKAQELGFIRDSGLDIRRSSLEWSGIDDAGFSQAFTVPNLLGCMASCDTLRNWILLELFSLLSVGKFRTIMRVNNRKFLFYLRVCRRATEPFPILFSENMIPSIMYYYSGRGRQWGNRRGARAFWNEWLGFWNKWLSPPCSYVWISGACPDANGSQHTLRAFPCRASSCLNLI